MFNLPDDLTPPHAERRPHTAHYHGVEVTDAYHWLRDPTYPKVEDADILRYLRSENYYYDAVMRQTGELPNTIFEEIKGRLKEDDSSVPWREGAWEYKWAFSAGAQYRQWFRRPVGAMQWNLILDEPELASGQEFFRLGGFAVSPDGRKLAYATDITGGERFTLYIKDLESGDILDIGLEDTAGELVWESASDGLYVVRLSPEWRPYQVLYQPLDGRPPLPVFEETDTGFFLHITESSDKRFLLIRSADHITSEYHTRPLGTTGPMTLCQARSTGHEYAVDHDEDGWLILSNRDVQNFSLYRADDPTGPWREILPGGDHRFVMQFRPFAGALVVRVRDDGLDKLLVQSRGSTDFQEISFEEEAYEVSFGQNVDYEQAFVRISYSSLVTPATVYDVDLRSLRREQRKRQEIPSGYQSGDYVGRRLTITARDGVEIPVSLVHRRDWQPGPGAKLHLYGYGAYGMGMTPGFSPARLSLLDRGFAYAIAHIRGGDEKGRGWYDAGKLGQRENTFNDFVDVSRGLIARGLTGAGQITISGGSAGGELMGAVLNQARDLYGAAVLHVPFVDVLNTMLDATLPLTPIEWPEWGNPIEDAAAFETIQGYCPYSNLAAGAYPPIMVTGGLSDPRVTYWEPAKYVAKLRTLKTDSNPLLLKINMEAGHGGKSGRYDRYLEVAEEYAFLVTAML